MGNGKALQSQVVSEVMQSPIVMESSPPNQKRLANGVAKVMVGSMASLATVSVAAIYGASLTGGELTVLLIASYFGILIVGSAVGIVYSKIMKNASSSGLLYK